MNMLTAINQYYYLQSIIMGDYPEYHLDTGIIIKQESMKQENFNDSNIMITSASVPIPARRDHTDYRDYSFDLDNCQSPLYGTVGLNTDQVLSPTNTYDSYWDNRIMASDDLKSEALIHMDEDDIFQVDKSDLIQGVEPTLAQLNAHHESLFEDLNFDDLVLPNDRNYTILENNPGPYTFSNNVTNNNNQLLGASSSCPQGIMYYKELELIPGVATANYDANSRTPVSALSPGSPASSSSSAVNSQTSPMHIQNLQPKQSTLHDLLMRDKYESSPDRSVLGQSMQGQNNTLHSPNVKLYRSQATSGLSSSAPTHLGLEQIWQRREPRKHLLSTSSLAECGSTSSLSTGGVLSPDPQDYSYDEGDSDEDSDGHYEDYSSDNNSDDDDDPPKNSKKEKYFWQYNIQSKGPKGQRLVMKSKMENPHVLNEVTDPVFSPDCSVRGIKHSGKLVVIKHCGKARKGDGNDLTPNPRKLFNIGKELDKLGRIINDMTPVSELPFNVRPNSRKEKNKLASRACRLKKKAQHEANKIKLNGLEHEHRRYLNTIQQLKQLIAVKINEPSPEARDEISKNIDKLSKNCIKGKIAGYTTEYVNKVLDKIKAGSSGNSALSSSLAEDV